MVGSGLFSEGLAHIPWSPQCIYQTKPFRKKLLMVWSRGQLLALLLQIPGSF